MLYLTTKLLPAKNSMLTNSKNAIHSLPQLRVPGPICCVFLCPLDGVVGQAAVGRGNCPADPAMVFPSCYQARVVGYTELLGLALQTMHVLRY